MNLEEFLREITQSSGVSGREESTTDVIEKFFTTGEGRRWITDLRRDRLGNLIIRKEGRRAHNGTDPPRIMFAAHQDEIGLIVTDIVDGFLRIGTVGGIDQRVLPGQEVMVHGKEKIPGIIGAKPPHLQTPDEREKAIKLEDMLIDLGFSDPKARELVSVGDFVSIDRNLITLKNSSYSGKSLDDRAGVAALLETVKRLQNLNHRAEVYFVATVQEEVGVRGAMTGAYGIAPDIGIAIDVTHGKIPGLSDEEAYNLGGGPVIALGPQVHPKIFEKLKSTAEENGVKYQIEPFTRPTGTDAFAIQIAQAGVATGLLGIPLRYMHTSVETVSGADIRESGRLLAEFVAGIDDSFVEGLKCF